MKRIIKIIAIIDALSFLIAGMLTWLITDFQFGTVLIYEGAILILIGSLFAGAGTGTLSADSMPLSRQADYSSPILLNDRDKRDNFCLLLSASSVLPIAIGILINKFI